MEVSTPTQAPREEGARSSPGAARGRCERPMMHQRPEDLWTPGFPSSGLRLRLGLGRSEVRVVRVGRAAPGLRKAEAAEAAEARTAQGPSRLESRESDPLRRSVEREVGQGPAARLRKRVLGAFRGWGSGKTHLNAEPLFFLSVKWD